MSQMVEIETITHVAFADESNHDKGRFRSIALISLKKDDLENMNESLIEILNESNVSEFKWSKLRSARVRFAACKMIHSVINKINEGKIRIDVLVWDIEDSRHKIKGRNDARNLERMYHHLFRNVLLNRWNDCGHWHLFPDEHMGIQWHEVHGFLEKKNERVRISQNMFAENGLSFELRSFGIHKITPKKSHEEPLVQVADLFAGMGVYSRQEYDTYEKWLIDSAPQLDFIKGDANIYNSTDCERFYVLKEFDRKCKLAKLGVSLKTNRGLRSLNPKSRLNFWWYEPQHEDDKAPINIKMILDSERIISHSA